VIVLIRIATRNAAIETTVSLAVGSIFDWRRPAHACRRNSKQARVCACLHKHSACYDNTRSVCQLRLKQAYLGTHLDVSIVQFDIWMATGPLYIVLCYKLLALLWVTDSQHT
jgi:hypothetical protein